MADARCDAVGEGGVGAARGRRPRCAASMCTTHPGRGTSSSWCEATVRSSARWRVTDTWRGASSVTARPVASGADSVKRRTPCRPPLSWGRRQGMNSSSTGTEWWPTGAPALRSGYDSQGPCPNHSSRRRARPRRWPGRTPRPAQQVAVQLPADVPPLGQCPAGIPYPAVHAQLSVEPRPYGHVGEVQRIRRVQRHRAGDPAVPPLVLVLDVRGVRSLHHGQPHGGASARACAPPRVWSIPEQK